MVLNNWLYVFGLSFSSSIHKTKQASFPHLTPHQHKAIQQDTRCNISTTLDFIPTSIPEPAHL